MQALIQYRTLPGPLADNLERASHVSILERR